MEEVPASSVDVQRDYARAQQQEAFARGAFGLGIGGAVSFLCWAIVLLGAVFGNDPGKDMSQAQRTATTLFGSLTGFLTILFFWLVLYRLTSMQSLVEGDRAEPDKSRAARVI